MRANTQKPRGFTIVEAAIAVAIVGILLSGSLTAMGAIAKSRLVQTERRVAYEVGQQLMAEILQQYFQDPLAAPPVFGPESGEVRATYDDVDDYNSFYESTLTRKDGTVLTDYSGWKRGVVVEYVDPASPTSAIASSTLKRVTVTVTAPSTKKYVLVGFRSQFGTYEYTPASQTNLVTWVGIDLQAGGRVKDIRTGARPLNVSTSQ